jgi:tetratricopeptide (TPR) repeat protein
MAVTLESLRKSVGKKNTNSMVFAWLADLERVAGELDKALQRVDGGLTLYPNDISARLVRAKILIQLEAYEPCVEECERIIVMDPFNLAAQRIMGDAYDKLGMLAERNVCYRRLHDMDPLNNFWKEEYDVVLESTAAAAAVGAAADSDIIMSDSTQDLGQSVGKETSPLDLSFDDDETSEPKTEDAGTESFEMPATEDSIDSETVDSDDPFASLAAMLPNGDSADDSTMEDLSASLESAMDSIKTDESEGLVEEFPADENISGSDVSSALSDMFGLDDDLEPEETTPASPFASAAPAADIPVSIDDNAQSNAESVFESASIDDKPQSIDDAFGDIFGEDELPEEKPQEEAKPQETSSFGSIEDLAESPLNEGIEDDDGDSLFEKSAEVSAPAEDKPQSIDDAFGDIFGEDELPEEKPQQEAAPQEESLELPAEEEGGLFEKSASADMNLTSDDSPAEVAELEAPAAEAAPAEDAPTTIDNAFDSIFGEDELPEEKPAEENAAAEPIADLELPAEESLELPVEETPSEEEIFKLDDEPVAEEAPALESPIDNLFADDAPAAPAAEETVVEEPAAEEIVAEGSAVEETPLEEASVEEAPVEAAPASDNDFSVDKAFDSLFGSEDDLPEEKPAEETLAETPAADLQETESETPVSLEEQVNQAEAELEMPEVKSESSDLAKEMGGAFASMFGDADDDLDLPGTAPQAESNEQELTGAPIEETFDKSAENVQETIESDLDKSFDNLFGKEDDLPAEGDNISAEVETALDASADIAPEAPAAESAQDLDSLESEVSGAFKGLFDMDDDSLTEETKPSNKGVDFLMSGDSDDEISAGLINDPDAPLDRGAQDLDESLNTRTLAEIYFDQGLYAKALEIYKDLAQKEPENEDIAARLSEVEKLYNEKFGGEA